MDHERVNLREAVWIGDSKAKLKEFPQPVQKDIGTLYLLSKLEVCLQQLNHLKALAQGFLRYDQIIGPILIAPYML